MIDPGLNDKVALITGANNPHGIGAAIAMAFATMGTRVFLHYYRQFVELPHQARGDPEAGEPGLAFFSQQQAKSADDVLRSIREARARADSWEADLGDAPQVTELLSRAEESFGRIDILVNNAAHYGADTFLPSGDDGEQTNVWEGGPMASSIDSGSHDRHFAVNSRAPAMLMRDFARRVIAEGREWGRIINISADCAWGSPLEVSYRGSKYALESFSRSAAAELGPHGITVNVVSPGPVQTGYITPSAAEGLIREIPMGRIGRPEDIANAVLFFASEQAGWITGQVLTVHGGHRMALGQL